ncbi:MAG TPA: hypothetical protein DCM14_01835, partial [Clostridiales bacterium UBA8153]|nr:hypothetical protein [Clostridiales bacterium UBA8153]
QQLGRIESPSAVESVSRLPQMTMNSYMGQLTSPYFLDRVISAAKLNRAVYTPSVLQRMVRIQIVRDANLLEVRVQHTDARLATDVANAIGQEFVVFLAEANQAVMDRAVVFLQEQLDVVGVEIENVREQLAELLGGGNGITVLTSRVAHYRALERQLSNAHLEADLDREVLRAVIGSLEVQLAATPAQLQERVETTTTVEEPGGAPRVQVNVEVRSVPNPTYLALESTLRTQQSALLTAEAELRVLRQREIQTTRQLDLAENELTRLQSQEQQLKRELSQLEKSQTQLFDRLLESQIARSADLGEASISKVSPALLPEVPIRPRKLLNVALAGVLGGMVSLGLVFVLEYLDNTLKRPEDITRVLEVPVLGALPVIPG